MNPMTDISRPDPVAKLRLFINTQLLLPEANSPNVLSKSE